VTWFIRDLPVVTWTIASFEPPDIAADRRTVLRIESNGSLTFLNVPVSYTDSYTINSNSHYSVENRSLVVLKPTRNDTGQYTLLLTNPFSSPFYISGDSLALSCRADGFPQPTVEWLFGGQTVSHARVLNITDVQTSQGGEYTCLLRNEETIKQREKIIHLKSWIHNDLFEVYT
uniref:Ig-like domain-containing protein n=1 Tax=Takifugu rubripes TaxID=31033 RepID=H2SHQ3_TAKRU